MGGGLGTLLRRILRFFCEACVVWQGEVVIEIP
jgi:hypothetical protein